MGIEWDKEPTNKNNKAKLNEAKHHIRLSEVEGLGYQTLVNQTLRASMTTGKPLDEVLLRRIIREEIQSTTLQVAA